jgi:hypothetical protein
MMAPSRSARRWRSGFLVGIDPQIGERHVTGERRPGRPTEMPWAQCDDPRSLDRFEHDGI